MFGLWQNTGTYSIHYTDISFEILKYYEDSKLDFINHKTLELWKIDSLVKSEGIVTKKGLKGNMLWSTRLKFEFLQLELFFLLEFYMLLPTG